MRRSRMLFALLTVIMLLGGYVTGCASSGQPHMTAARDELRAARQELEAANNDKGGHRARAIGLVDDAVVQVDQGIDYARTH